MSRRQQPKPVGPPAAWPREKLLALVVVAGLTCLLLVAGLVYSVGSALAPPPTPAALPHAPDAPALSRDAIAAAPMMQVPREAAFQAVPALTAAPPIHIPEPTIGRGPAGVPTGFPHTPQGAVGQLAAVDRLVLEQMSVPLTRDVHTAWTLDGAVGLEEWIVAGHVQSFLGNAKQGATKDVTTVIEVTPVAAQVKGTDGPDWVLACVLYDVRATIRTTSRMGYGRCERLQWHDGRWQIAPGPAPAVAPSAWPGSQVANDAGWLTWTPTP